MWFYKRGKCGCFILIDKWCCWAQSALHAIWLNVQSGSDNLLCRRVTLTPIFCLFCQWFHHFLFHSWMFFVLASLLIIQRISSTFWMLLLRGACHHALSISRMLNVLILTLSIRNILISNLIDSVATIHKSLCHSRGHYWGRQCSTKTMQPSNKQCDQIGDF